MRVCVACLLLLLSPTPSQATRSLSATKWGPSQVRGLDRRVTRRPSARAVNNMVMMTLNEQTLVYSFLNTKKGASMLEWGSGGSSKHYAQFVEQYYSIEHNREWYGEFKPTADTVANLNYYLQAVDPGTFGWPGGFIEGNYKAFRNYVRGPEQIGRDSYDIILVDGRARVACAVYALRLLHPHSFVIVHDFMPRLNKERRQQTYSKMLDYYDILASVDTLVVLQAKQQYVGTAISESILQQL